MIPAQTNNNACNDLLVILFIPALVDQEVGREILSDLLMRDAQHECVLPAKLPPWPNNRIVTLAQCLKQAFPVFLPSDMCDIHTDIVRCI